MQCDKKWLTIITPVFNGSKTIKNTIHSVLKSKKEDIEYIIVDGKSSDKTVEIVKKFKKGVDKIISESDKGIYDALNKGIQIATGDYVMMLASGDLLLEHALYTIRNTLKKQVDIFCGTTIHHSKIGFQFSDSEEDLKKLKIYCSLRHPASIFKRSSFAKFGNYNTNLKCAGDREIFLRWYLNGAQYQIEKIPVVLFDSGAGISTADPNKYMIPEDKEISMMYGTSMEVIRKHMELQQTIANPSIIKRSIKKILIYLHVYRTITQVMGQDKHFLSREQMKYYGIIEKR